MPADVRRGVYRVWRNVVPSRRVNVDDVSTSSAASVAAFAASAAAVAAAAAAGHDQELQMLVLRGKLLREIGRRQLRRGNRERLRRGRLPIQFPDVVSLFWLQRKRVCFVHVFVHVDIFVVVGISSVASVDAQRGGRGRVAGSARPLRRDGARRFARRRSPGLTAARSMPAARNTATIDTMR